MPALADIFLRYRCQYVAQFGAGMLPSHRRAMNAIIVCRTPSLGGSLYRCPSCERKHYSYHSCGHRHCPRCGFDSAEKWARSQSARIPRGPCFLMTVTVPHELNSLIRSHQNDLYALMFSASAEAIKKLCADQRHLGAQPGMLGVLHTWGRDIGYHPHVHFIVPAGGINPMGKWMPTRHPDFLVPVKALSVIFRAKFRDALKRLGLFDAVPAIAWEKSWVIHCEPAGQGPEIIRYLARYIHRVAITNSNIISLKNNHVTFRYQPVGTKIWKTMTLPALAFMARFLQHVLPKGFTKVRYYGFLHPRCAAKLESVREQLGASPQPVPEDAPQSMLCPVCQTPLQLVTELPRTRGPP
ncbi:MAG: transposase [Lentisphaerales bacterium]|nr:MAG: transposase [Lentisphaerales bacterium]